MAIEWGAYVRNVHRDDVERATNTGFPLHENPLRNQW